eukprot:2855701-Amphidinium_carterae.1
MEDAQDDQDPECLDAIYDALMGLVDMDDVRNDMASYIHDAPMDTAMLTSEKKTFLTRAAKAMQLQLPDQ